MADEIDMDEVRKLLDAIEYDLYKAQGDPGRLQSLRAAVETLRNVLKSPIRRHHWVSESLHDLRHKLDTGLDTALAESWSVSRYIAEIGRILGM